MIRLRLVNLSGWRTHLRIPIDVLSAAKTICLPHPSDLSQCHATNLGVFVFVHSGQWDLSNGESRFSLVSSPDGGIAQGGQIVRKIGQTDTMTRKVLSCERQL